MPTDGSMAELETGAYRILQEALTNAAKHGAATHVAVDMVEDGQPALDQGLR